MDAKFEPTHGGKGYEHEESEIMKVLQELRSDVNCTNRKLDQALIQLSSLETMLKSVLKQQDHDSNFIDLTGERPKSSDEASLSIEEEGSKIRSSKGGRFRQRKVNAKLRSPVSKVLINKKVNEKKGISAEQAVCIQFVQHYCRAKPDTILVHVGAYNAWVTAKSLKCLTIDKKKDGASKWLDDNVMEAYAKLIMHRHASSVNAKLFIVWSVVNCKLIPNFTSHNLPKNAHELAVMLTENDRVYFPMIVKRGNTKHWILLVKNNRINNFQVLDSLWELSTYREQIDKMIMGINAILGVCTPKANVLSWDVIQEGDIPQQKDGCSCGLYVLRFIELWNGFYLPQDFGESDVHTFRLRVLVELVLAELNDMADVKEEILIHIRK